MNFKNKYVKTFFKLSPEGSHREPTLETFKSLFSEAGLFNYFKWNHVNQAFNVIEKNIAYQIKVRETLSQLKAMVSQPRESIQSAELPQTHNDKILYVLTFSWHIEKDSFYFR